MKDVLYYYNILFLLFHIFYLGCVAAHYPYSVAAYPLAALRSHGVLC